MNLSLPVVMTELCSQFNALFGPSEEEISAFFAPGRINLIGEHIDYNGGPVMPFAIEKGITLLLRKNNRNILRLYSQNFPATIYEFFAQDSYSRIPDLWVNYPLGCVNRLQQISSQCITGLDLFFSGNIPNRAGLSSSASIEIVTLFSLNDYFNLNLQLIDIVRLAKKVENEFVGVQCGIMDQYAVAFGRKNKILVLDCALPSHEEVDATIPGYEFIVINTNKSRTLAGSHYNERFAECRNALERLQRYFPIENLCDLTPSDLKTIKPLFNDHPAGYRRVQHVVTEKKRVALAVEALHSGDILQLGRLMNQSHASLRDDYEVTGLELDSLTSLMQSIEGVAGSRMTGAGFGGCTLSLVKKGVFQANAIKIGETYRKITGLEAVAYSFTPSDGVSRMTI